MEYFIKYYKQSKLNTNGANFYFTKPNPSLIVDSSIAPIALRVFELLLW